jgi:hypothetical protein
MGRVRCRGRYDRYGQDTAWLSRHEAEVMVMMVVAMVMISQWVVNQSLEK